MDLVLWVSLVFSAFSARISAQKFKWCSFSAPEIQRTLYQMMTMGKTACSDSFHWKKWTNLQHLERLQHQKCCTIWPLGGRSTVACMLFFAQLASPCRSTEVSPWLAVMISVDFDLDVALRTQIPVFHSKLKQNCEFSELVPIMFQIVLVFPISARKSAIFSEH